MEGEMKGDCSTCDHSLAARCTQGDEGVAFLLSDEPLPCPVWAERGEKWELESKAWTQRNPWPFQIPKEVS